jgi:hypothetical protein
MIKIENVIIGFNQVANGVELIQGGYQLGSNEGCKVKVNFFVDNDFKLQVLVDIPSPLVINWINDDEIIAYVLNELNLIVKPNEQGIY